VLVNSDETCKVADFGLSRGATGDGRESYYRSRGGAFPVRWTSPEGTSELKFSEASDVWSFAIVVLEIFTNGTAPYPGMDNAMVIVQVMAGYRTPQPSNCPNVVYKLMTDCWDQNPESRPLFRDILSRCAKIVDESNSGALGASHNPHMRRSAGAASSVTVVEEEVLEADREYEVPRGSDPTFYPSVVPKSARGAKGESDGAATYEPLAGQNTKRGKAVQPLYAANGMVQQVPEYQYVTRPGPQNGTEVNGYVDVGGSSLPLYSTNSSVVPTGPALYGSSVIPTDQPTYLDPTPRERDETTFGFGADDF